MPRNNLRVERKINLGRKAPEGSGDQLAIAVAIGAAVLGAFALIAAVVSINM